MNRTVKSLVSLVGFLAAVEFASGILQGYYTPIFTDIARNLKIGDADLNWFEASQLIVSALCVPILARLGDLIGHKKILLLSTALTALGSWWLAFAPDFTSFLIGWSIQGFYVVWLPLEVAIIYRRTAERGEPEQRKLTRRGAAILVGCLELSVIVGALSSGQLVEAVSMPMLLAIPAMVVSIVGVLIWVGIETDQPSATGSIDWSGFALVTIALLVMMAGLIVIRIEHIGSLLAWALILGGIALLVVFGWWELKQTEPLVDMRLFASNQQWPVQLTAFLFGMSVLGAQIPLSTFARADPAVVGYGLGASAGFVSTLIGVYVICLAIGAFSLPLVATLVGDRGSLVLAGLLVGAGYAMWLPWHQSTVQALINMAVAGIGSGALVAALPAAAAAAAPANRTGMATGMTNGIKTVGGAFASSIFAIALSATGSLEGPAAGHPTLGGYLTVWSVCAVAALIAAACLAFAPRPAAPPADLLPELEDDLWPEPEDEFSPATTDDLLPASAAELIAAPDPSATPPPGPASAG